jgi:hypothetical protein
MRSELRRLQTIARKLNRCPRHPGEKLQCGPCDWMWTGTDAEFWELNPLQERLAPYFAHMDSQGTCRCGSGTWCGACFEAAAAQVRVPADLFSPDERERYFALLEHMQRKRMSNHG